MNPGHSLSYLEKEETFVINYLSPAMLFLLLLVLLWRMVTFGWCAICTLSIVWQQFEQGTVRARRPHFAYYFQFLKIKRYNFNLWFLRDTNFVVLDVRSLLLSVTNTSFVSILDYPFVTYPYLWYYSRFTLFTFGARNGLISQPFWRQ
jgi:hypothetical protein